MMLFLALQSIAAERGDGLRPELVAQIQRYARSRDNRIASTSEEIGESLLDIDALRALTAMDCQ